MDSIYPITALQKNTREVREQANKSLVHITENGCAAYIFCSEQVFAEQIQKERDDAAYEARLSEAVERGLADIDSGNHTDSIEAAFAQSRSLRERVA